MIMNILFLLDSFLRSMESMSVEKGASTRHLLSIVLCSRRDLLCKSSIESCIFLEMNVQTKKYILIIVFSSFCSDAMETVIHSADAFAPVGYLHFSMMHTEDKVNVSLPSCRVRLFLCQRLVVSVEDVNAIQCFTL